MYRRRERAGKWGLKGEHFIMWRSGRAVVTASGRTKGGHIEDRRDLKTHSDLVNTHTALNHLRHPVPDFNSTGHHMASLGS